MQFGTKMSISAFKAKHNADTMSVILNPNTGKSFLSCDNTTVGAVSKNYDASKEKEMVELVMDDGAIIWCLHNPSNVNVIEVL